MRSRALGDVTINNEYIPSFTYRPDELPYRPAHQFDIEAGYRFRFGLDAGFDGMYVSESVYYNREDPTTNKVMAAIREKLDGYFLANVKFTQKLAGGFSLTFAVKNLLNQQYETLYLYPAAGRSYHGGIKFSL
jgi:outer membrane receptor protein involved in Fe transport